MFEKVVNFGASLLTLPKAPTAPKLKKQDSAKLQSNSQKQESDGGTIPITAPCSYKENSPPASTVKIPRGKATHPSVSAAGPAKARDAPPAAELKPPVAPSQQQPVGIPPSSDIKPHRGSRVPPPSSAACKPQHQPAAKAEAASGSRPPSRQNSSGGIPRTGDEIWAANLQLGRIAEQFADLEDAKPRRRRAKSPSLQEKLHKHWCGSYGDKLAREHAHLDVELPSAPQYEPPSFLKDSNTDSDGDEEDVCPTSQPHSDTLPDIQSPLGSPAPAPRARGAAKPAAPDTINIVSRSPSDTGTPSGPPTHRAAATAAPPPPPPPERSTTAAAGKTSGKRAASGSGGRKHAAKQPNAGPGTAVGPQPATGPETVDGGAAGRPHDVVSDGMEEEAIVVVQRKQARKLKVADAGVGAKESKSRPAARRRVQAPAVELGGGEQDGAMEHHQQQQPSLQHQRPQQQSQPPQRATDDAGAPSGSVPPKPVRDRKSHLPASVSFGVPMTAMGNKSLHSCTTSHGGEGEGAGGAGEVPQQQGAASGPGVATATKRSREGTSGGGCDDKGRVNKAVRLEQQQQAKDNEVLRQRLVDMEMKNKELELKSREQSELIRQLQTEAKTVDRRVQQAEKDRVRESAENERLRVELNTVKEELKTAKEELKTLKTREGKERKQVEGLVQDWARQLEQMQKGWQRG